MTKEEFIQRLGMLFSEYEEGNLNRIIVGANVCIQFPDDSVAQYSYDGEKMVEGLDGSYLLNVKEEENYGNHSCVERI